MSKIKYNRKDNDGHKYLIPKDMLDDFDNLLSRIENAPFMSTKKWAAEDDFIELFSQYMVG
jgi:hypothetical protein